MKSKLMLLLITLAFTCSTSQAAPEAQDVFSFAAYDWALENKDIIRAARCKAVDESLYGKQKNDYEKIVAIRGFSSGKGSHQLLEYRLAFYHLASYYNGYIAALNTRGADVKTKILNVLTRDLNCDELNELTDTGPTKSQTP